VNIAITTMCVSCARTEDRIHQIAYEGDAWPNTRPRNAIPTKALAVVTNGGSDTLSLLDLDKNEVLASPPIDLDPVGNDGPRHAAIDAKGEYFYTALSFPHPSEDAGQHHSAGTSPGVLLRLRSDDLLVMGTRSLFADPADVVLTPDGQRLLVTHFDFEDAVKAAAVGTPIEVMRTRLSIVDAKTMTIAGLPTPCVAAQGIAVAADAKRAFLACYGEDAIGVVHLDEAGFACELWPIGKVLSTPSSVTYGPSHLALDRSGALLVVAEEKGREVRIVDIATKNTLATVDTRAAAGIPAMAADGSIWIVPTTQPDALITISANTWTETRARTFLPGECERPIQVARHGTRWFVVCQGDQVKGGRVLEIDAATLTSVRSFEVGVSPDFIAFVPEGS
jgi:DNA-binding beta-propeller fold protein YncE